jgi:hypothetical protein
VWQREGGERREDSALSTLTLKAGEKDGAAQPSGSEFGDPRLAQQRGEPGAQSEGRTKARGEPGHKRAVSRRRGTADPSASLGMTKGGVRG